MCASFPNQIHVGFNDRDVSQCEDFMSIIEQLEPGKMARKKCEEDIKPDIDIIQAVAPLPTKPGMAADAISFSPLSLNYPKCNHVTRSNHGFVIPEYC